jgi:hypothetical protein
MVIWRNCHRAYAIVDGNQDQPIKPGTPTQHEPSTIQDDVNQDSGSISTSYNNETETQEYDIKPIRTMQMSKVKCDFTHVKIERYNNKLNKVTINTTCNCLSGNANLNDSDFSLKYADIRTKPINNINFVIDDILTKTAPEFLIPCHISKAELMFYRRDEMDSYTLNWKVPNTTPNEDKLEDGAKLIKSTGVVKFNGGQTIYRIYKGIVESSNGDKKSLKLWVLNTEDGGNSNFSDNNFRLKIGDEISKPSNNLNLVTDRHEDLIGELQFQIPANSTKAELVIKRRDEEGVISVEF